MGKSLFALFFLKMQKIVQNHDLIAKSTKLILQKKEEFLEGCLVIRRKRMCCKNSMNTSDEVKSRRAEKKIQLLT